MQRRTVARRMAFGMLVALAALCGRVADAFADAAAAPVKAEGAAKRPNVLFIAVDDLRPELGCYGATQIKTPHMDSLAAGGVVFNRAYCQEAICSPSRISLLTGRRPDTTRIYHINRHNRDTLPDVVTLPQHFKLNGYHAQGFGKIYHGGLDDATSWSVPHTPNRAMQYADPKILAHVRAQGVEGWEQGGKNKGPAWEAADCPHNALPDGWIADRAIEAMRQVKDKPFFLAVGFEKPHLPFVAPKEYFEPYPLESIQVPPDNDAPEGAPRLALTDWGELRAYQGVPKKGPLSERQTKELIRAYYAATTYADAQVGRLLAELESLGLADNTIVLLWGDHGYQLGEQGLWCKHTNFENSVRVPLLVRAPGRAAAGGKTDGLVELVDVYPALCDLAGLPLPEGLEGTSFAPLLNEPTRAWKSGAFSQYPREGEKVMGYSVRTDRYRYTEWQRGWKDGGERQVVARELYDHQADPRETKNVAENPANQETVRKLSEQLTAGWQAARPGR